MKTILAFLAALLCGPLLAGCGAASETPATPFAESMKGYELYSWQDGSTWKFSLLVGTNREKNLDEIKSASAVLSGVEALKAALQQMPAGQYITWSSKETLSFPPQDIIEQVEKVCEEQGLILQRAGASR
jgi:hypothetical protein